MDNVELSEVPTSAMIDDIDDKGAAAFLVKHHVPFIGPDMGVEMVKILKRLDAVKVLHDLPPTVDAYRLALHLAVQVAAAHQNAFCNHMEGLLKE